MKPDRGDEVVLQVYHLDDDEEADLVAGVLQGAVLAAGCRFERPNEATNSVLIFCESGCEHEFAEPRINSMLEQAETLVRSISIDDARAIADLGLDMRIYVRAEYWRVRFPPTLALICGERSIAIEVYDVEKMMKGIRTPYGA